MKLRNKILFGGLLLIATLCAYLVLSKVSISKLGLNGQIVTPPSSGGTVGGSGTVNPSVTNTVAFFPAAGNTVTGTTALFWDNTNSRLGIGSSTPSTELVVTGTSTITGRQVFLGGAQFDGTAYALGRNATSALEYTVPVMQSHYFTAGTIPLLSLNQATTTFFATATSFGDFVTNTPPSNSFIATFNKAGSNTFNVGFRNGFTGFTTNDGTDFQLLSNGGFNIINRESTAFTIWNASVQRFSLSNTGQSSFTPGAVSSGIDNEFSMIAAASTGQAAGANVQTILWNLGATLTHANGNLSSSTDFLIIPRKHDFASASSTISNQFCVLCIKGGPVLGSQVVVGVTTTPAAFQVMDGGASVFEGRVHLGKGAAVASGSTTTLGADGNMFHITGTTNIDCITTSTWRGGSEVTLVFDGILTVNDASTCVGPTANMDLAGSFSTTANDVLKLQWDGLGNSWLEIDRSVN